MLRLTIRYDTMRQINGLESSFDSSWQNNGEGVPIPHIYLASGENFPDALTGAVLAAQEQAPLVLVNDSLPQETIDLLAVAAPVKVTVPEVKTTTTTTPAKTIGKLTIYQAGDTNLPGDYVGEIVDGKAEGEGTVHWHGGDWKRESTWKGTFWHGAPGGFGIGTYTDENGEVKTVSGYLGV